MIGHVGAKVSALLDGQLAEAESDRMWAHVHTCGHCRREVEREGWVKTRLAGLALCAPLPEAPEHLRGSLASVTGWPDSVPYDSERRRTVLVAAIGAGSLGAALVGVLAVSVPANAPGFDRRAPVTSLTRPADDPGAVVTTPRPIVVGKGRAGATAAEVAATGLLPQMGTANRAWVTISP